MGHPAVFPIGLPEFFIKFFTAEDDKVLDPFTGSGTTGIAALQNNRSAVLIDNKEEYINVMRDRLRNLGSLYHSVKYHEQKNVS